MSNAKQFSDVELVTAMAVLETSSKRFAEEATRLSMVLEEAEKWINTLPSKTHVSVDDDGMALTLARGMPGLGREWMLYLAIPTGEAGERDLEPLRSLSVQDKIFAASQLGPLLVALAKSAQELTAEAARASAEVERIIGVAAPRAAAPHGKKA